MIPAKVRREISSGLRKIRAKVSVLPLPLLFPAELPSPKDEELELEGAEKDDSVCGRGGGILTLNRNRTIVKARFEATRFAQSE